MIEAILTTLCIYLLTLFVLEGVFVKDSFGRFCAPFLFVGIMMVGLFLYNAKRDSDRRQQDEAIRWCQAQRCGTVAATPLTPAQQEFADYLKADAPKH